MSEEETQQEGEVGAEGGEKKFTWEEVAKHKTAQSLWVVIHDKVYDITKFMEEVRSHARAAGY